MKEFYDDRLDAADAISTLANGLNGKAFIEEGCVEPYYEGWTIDEGVTLYIADKTQQEKNGAVSFLPYLNTSGNARLKIVCCVMQQTDETASARKEYVDKWERHEVIPC